jgi:DNA polymerase-3 subunit gamma/tau
MTEHETDANYLVLARKHRPASFAGLIGQDAMVRTLKNAIATGRLAQAFILTGVRGVGKTTTARIIARALNCVGADGAGGPTAEPCGQCEHCRAIAEDHHVDVIEMDAASRTGVDDIRELIDGVRYRPVSARYKVYILDEVHMLSPKAFNALLKTLEEPPEHVKFIFATTEIRRVPVTVLSRCQRFDLRRVEPDILAQHLARIAQQEGARVAPEAIALLARAADGSVRDGLSLLDTAIAHGPTPETDTIGEGQIREMLGLADRSLDVDLFERVMAGDIPRVLDQLAGLYAAGADPAVVMQDLLDVCHWLTRLKLVPGAAESPDVPAAERQRGADMAEKLTVATLARAWQMLLKGLGEVQGAPTPLAAAEMALVRLGYAAELPNPAELVQRLGENTGAPQAASRESSPSRPAPPRRVESAEPFGDERPRAYSGAGTAALRRTAPQPEAEVEREDAPAPGALEPAGSSAVESFEQAAALFVEKREMVLYAHLRAHVHPVHFEPGRIEIRTTPQAPANLANRMGELLGRWTGRRWLVTVSQENGEPTLEEREKAETARVRAHIAADPLVRAVLEAFPGASLERIRERSRPDESHDEGDSR